MAFCSSESSSDSSTLNAEKSPSIMLTPTADCVAFDEIIRKKKELFLLLFYTDLLIIAHYTVVALCNLTPHAQASDRWLPMLIIGSLMFIPGSYHTYLAYYAWKGEPGFSFALIPDWDEK